MSKKPQMTVAQAPLMRATMIPEIQKRMDAHQLHSKLHESVKVLGCSYAIRRHVLDEHPDCKASVHADLSRQIGTGLAEQGLVEFGQHVSERDAHWGKDESPFDNIVVTAQVVVMSYSDYMEIMRLSNELAL